jgi:hypothetical protein
MNNPVSKDEICILLIECCELFENGDTGKTADSGDESYNAASNDAR